ncbi:hypothetical protein LCL95_04475 [Bacillus timonensis]|nr:hypothetical protein [Bacillus timonensis]
MKMNLYFEIAIILTLLLGFVTIFSLFKETHKKKIKVVSVSFISAISLMILWRASQLSSYL